VPGDATSSADPGTLAGPETAEYVGKVPVGGIVAPVWHGSIGVGRGSAGTMRAAMLLP